MALSHAILTSLLDQDLTGYELAKQFDVSLGFFWQASHQQIYQQLKVLHEQGLVSANEEVQSGKPDKKRYAMTESGRDYLNNWVHGETKRKPAKDDLPVKLYNMGTVDNAVLERALSERRTHHEQKLALYFKIRERGYSTPEELEPSRLGMYLALLAGIKQEQGFIEWCDEAIEVLKSSQKI